MKKMWIITILALVACDDNGAEENIDAGLAGQGGEAGQGGTAGTISSEGDEVRSEKSRVMAPDVASEELELLTQGEQAFSLELHQILKKDGGNLFYSPFSISQALAMTWAGARAETEAEMAEVLHFDLEQARLHPAYNALDLELMSRADDLGGQEEGDGFELSIANALWGRIGWSFLEEFLDTLALNYGAGMRLMDFVNQAEEARLTINAWVEEKTQGRIKDLLKPGTVNPNTVLVLTNAIYFKASWFNQFDEESTEEAQFKLLEGGEAPVEMMHQETRLPYYTGAGFQAFALPYVGMKVSMLALLPDEGNFESFEESLDGVLFQEILEGLREQRVELGFPKFSFESEFSLKAALSSLGMERAFGDADFSGIDGSQSLYIGDVIHKAFVAVDEEGTEAAAATAVVMEGSAAPPPETIHLEVDRPFLFFIRDQTGAILFVGRVTQP